MPSDRSKPDPGPSDNRKKVATDGAFGGRMSDPFKSGTGEEDRIRGLVGRMTLEQKIGQMLMIGYGGPSADAAVKLIRTRHVGSVILFTRNIINGEQLRGQVDRMQEAALDATGAMLLVAVDQEGGQVARLKPPLCPSFPSNAARGVRGDIDGVREQAIATASALREVGINMNLAPVLDVCSRVENHTIGSRSYGENPETASRLGAAYIGALQENGVIATAKHFPGHGATTLDSHRVLPVVDLPAETLIPTHIEPFRWAIRGGVEAVMPAHIVYRRIDSRPATLSAILLRNWLRRSLGFDGVIVTDSLRMGALANHYRWSEIVLGAVAAGADILLIPGDADHQRRAHRFLLSAVRKGRLEEDRIDESVTRILLMKARYGLAPS